MKGYSDTKGEESALNIEHAKLHLSFDKLDNQLSALRKVQQVLERISDELYNVIVRYEKSAFSRAIGQE
jgi:hypothetical protein